MSGGRRVLLVAHQYWPTPGAASSVLGALVKELQDRGSEVVVLTCASDNVRTGTSITGPHGEEVRFVAPPETNRVGLDRVRALWEFMRGIRRSGKIGSFDVVVSDPPPTAGYAALKIARKRSIPFVFYLADSWSGVSSGADGLAGLAHRFIKALETRVLRSSSIVLGATHGMAEIAGSLGAPNIVVVENGVPLEVFAPTGPVWNPAGADRPYFLYAGNAGVVHGADVFSAAAVEMWTEGADFDLVFMGYGRDLSRVANIPDRFRDRLHLIESQPASKVAEAFRGAIGGLCSLRPIEQYADARPIKAMTSLACGVPVVYAGAGRFAEFVVDQQVGFVNEWSVAGARRSLSAAIEWSSSESGMATMKERCVAVAEASLSDVVAARLAADYIGQVG